MLQIRIGYRFLAGLGMAMALVLGLVGGALLSTGQVGAAPRPDASVRAAPAPVAQATPLTTELSMQLMHAAVDYANQNDFRMSIAIVDANGNLKALMRMDGARFMTADISHGKAFTAAAFGRSTGVIAQSFAQNEAFWGSLSSLGRPIVTGQGALPIMVDGELVGAIGASGGSSQQDEDTARAALDALGLP